MIVLTIDTLRADRLGIYGHHRDTSPNIDALALDSIVFDNAVTPETMTQPSVASMWTSLYPYETGVVGNLYRLEDGYVTLAEILQAASFDTGAFVSNYVLIRELSNQQQGFAVYDDVLDKERLAGGERRAAGTVDRALEWLDRERTGPFFLWVHLMDPHGPYDPPAPFDEAFRRRGGKPRLIARARIPVYQFRGSRDRRFYLDNYDGEIAYMDRELGRLLDGLRERGLYDDALIVFQADHGEHLGEHGIYFSHAGHVYEGALRVPLLLKLPGSRRAGLPERSAELVSLLDVAPTVLDVVGLPIPDHYRGRSLLEAGSDEDGRKLLVRSAGPQVRALRTRDRVLIHIIDSKTRKVVGREYYDLASDPRQRSDQPLDATGKMLGSLLTEWRHREAEYRAEFPAQRHERTEMSELLAGRTPGEEARRQREALEALGYVE